MEKSLGLLPCSNRTDIFRVSLFQKIYYNDPSMYHGVITLTTYLLSRKDQRFKVGIPMYRTNTKYNLFVSLSLALIGIAFTPT